MTVSSMPQLRPLGIGQLLDQSIRLYRQNFFKFIGIIALVQIPLGLLQLGSSLLLFNSMPQFDNNFGSAPTSLGDIFGPAYLIGLSSTLLLGLLSFLLIQGLATAAMTLAIASSYLGESLTIIEAYKKIGSSWLSLVGALLLSIIFTLAFLVWTLVPCIGWLTGFGILIFFGSVIIPLIAPTIVLEKQPASQSIRRVWDLVRRRFWWVVGFVLILSLFSQIIITGPVLVLNLIFQWVFGNPLVASTTQPMIQTVLQSITQIVGTLIYIPLQLTAMTLMYFDLRVRTEGFDLTLLTNSSTDTSDNVIDITAQAPPAENSNLITWEEMGYFVLIEIGSIALYFVIVSVLGAVFLSFFAAGASSGF